MKEVTYPCRSCIYYNTCGSYARQERCDGRMTKTEKEKMLKKIEQRVLNGERV